MVIIRGFFQSAKSERAARASSPIYGDVSATVGLLENGSSTFPRKEDYSWSKGLAEKRIARVVASDSHHRESGASHALVLSF